MPSPLKIVSDPVGLLIEVYQRDRNRELLRQRRVSTLNPHWRWSCSRRTADSDLCGVDKRDQRFTTDR
jgi:hypothetical protein